MHARFHFSFSNVHLMSVFISSSLSLSPSFFSPFFVLLFFDVTPQQLKSYVTVVHRFDRQFVETVCADVTTCNVWLKVHKLFSQGHGRTDGAVLQRSSSHHGPNRGPGVAAALNVAAATTTTSEMQLLHARGFENIEVFAVGEETWQHWSCQVTAAV